MSPQPGCVNSSSFICFCRKHSLRYCSILEIVPITRPGSSSSLTLPPVGSSSSSSLSSPSSSLLEPARLHKLSLMAFNISSNVVLGLVVVNPTFSAFLIWSCTCSIAVSASSTRFLATVVSLSTWSSIHFSFTSLLKKWVSRRLPAASFILDRTLRNTPRARTSSGSKPRLRLFAWWHRVMATCDPRPGKGQCISIAATALRSVSNIWPLCSPYILTRSRAQPYYTIIRLRSTSGVRPFTHRCVEHFVDLPFLPACSGERSFFGALIIVFCVEFVDGRDVGCCEIWTT